MRNRCPGCGAPHASGVTECPFCSFEIATWRTEERYRLVLGLLFGLTRILFGLVVLLYLWLGPHYHAGFRGLIGNIGG